MMGVIKDTLKKPVGLKNNYTLCTSSRRKQTVTVVQIFERCWQTKKGPFLYHFQPLPFLSLSLSLSLSLCEI
jgi:hypothetical protein